MNRLTYVLCSLALLSACLQSHGSGTMAIGDENCVLCHQADYDRTSTPLSATLKIPDHKVLGYATTCVDCHVTGPNPLPWKLATDHTEKVFSISGGSPHQNIACTSCHNLDLVDPANPQVPVGSSVKGENTDCTSCHHNDATQQTGHAATVNPITFPTGTRYAGQTYVYMASDHRFCLDCHPSGTGGTHNEAIFPSHHNNNGTCSNCHNPALGSDAGGQNAPCVNSHCHTNIRPGHQGDQDQGPTSCLRCHPHGQGGGD